MIGHGAARLDLGDGWPDRWSVSWKIGKREARALLALDFARDLADAGRRWRRGSR
jgi:hypothetical protein